MFANIHFMTSNYYFNNSRRGFCKRKVAGLPCEVGTRKRTCHILSGSVLSVWSKVESILSLQPSSAGKMQIIRTKLDNGHKVVGKIYLPLLFYVIIICDSLGLRRWGGVGFGKIFPLWRSRGHVIKSMAKGEGRKFHLKSYYPGKYIGTLLSYRITENNWLTPTILSLQDYLFRVTASTPWSERYR